MADTTVEAAVLTWVEQHPALAELPVSFETEPPDGTDGAMVLSIPGDPYLTRYKGGGYIAEYAFSVAIRRNNPDTQGRLDTLAMLGDMGASIDDKSTWPIAPAGFDFHRMAVRTKPVRASHDESGADDYQITFTLTYRKEG